MILLIKTNEKNHVIKKAEVYLEEKGFLDHVKAKMIPFEQVEVIGHASGGVCPFKTPRGMLSTE